MSVRPRSPGQHPNHNSGSSSHHSHHNTNSGQSSRKAEPYYCDKYLVQSLVKDAMITDNLDLPSRSSRREDKQ